MVAPSTYKRFNALVGLLEEVQTNLSPHLVSIFFDVLVIVTPQMKEVHGASHHLITAYIHAYTLELTDN
jgi:hypothetical protein